MELMMVRAKIKVDSIDEIEAAGRKLFSAIDRGQLQGISYASFRLPDGVTYPNFLQLEDGIQNPLPHCRRAKSWRRS